MPRSVSVQAWRTPRPGRQWWDPVGPNIPGGAGVHVTGVLRRHRRPITAGSGGATVRRRCVRRVRSTWCRPASDDELKKLPVGERNMFTNRQSHSSNCYFLLCPGRGGGGGAALVVGSNFPPFLGSKLPAPAMVKPPISLTAFHAMGVSRCAQHLRWGRSKQTFGKRRGVGVPTRSRMSIYPHISDHKCLISR